MIKPMDPLPTSPDDPRLDHWYHTLELAPGVITRGDWDHRTTVDLVGLPASLAGKTALDVGTADGFWAFEMERRGADRVVAIDVEHAGDVDLLPRHRATHSRETLMSTRWPEQFATAHACLKSKVEHKICSVYDLSPERVGEFDVTYCGSLLLHLFNPLQALINIRSVTREVAIIETVAYHPDPIETTFPDRPYMWFGHLDWEGDRPGVDIGYWSFTPRALCDMLIYAGFAWVEPLDQFPMKRAGIDATVPVSPVIAHVAPNPDLKGWYKTRAKPAAAAAQVGPGQRVDPPQPAPVPAASRPLWRRALSKMRSVR
jgi:tRNA (mo5U34)-methyltransferase